MGVISGLVKNKRVVVPTECKCPEPVECETESHLKCVLIGSFIIIGSLVAVAIWVWFRRRVFKDEEDVVETSWDTKARQQLNNPRLENIDLQTFKQLFLSTLPSEQMLNEKQMFSTSSSRTQLVPPPIDDDDELWRARFNALLKKKGPSSTSSSSSGVSSASFATTLDTMMKTPSAPLHN